MRGHARQLCDLCLADVLVQSGAALSVVLQLKGHPTFVSDALGKDVLATCDYVESLGGPCVSVAKRWREHIAAARCELGWSVWVESTHRLGFGWSVRTSQSLSPEPALSTTLTHPLLVIRVCSECGGATHGS
jgi:hypothetical protein